MFSSSILHYIIWSNKCYLLIHIIVEIHLFGYLVELSLSPSATFSSSPWLLMNSCFGTCFHSSFPENLTMSSRQIVPHLLFSSILSLRYPDTNQNWISVRYDGWTIFPRVITLVFNPIRWCHPNTPARRAYCYSFLFSNVRHFSMRKL